MEQKAIAALLERCQAGDRAAWDALVDAYWQRLYAYALRATRNPELAQDLVQETFLRIVQRLGSYDDQGKFEAWLFRILVNLVRDHGRSQSRRPMQSTMHDKHGESTGDMTDEMPGNQAMPHEPVELGEDLVRLKAAMERLPDGDREIIMLRHFGDVPFKEIAHIFGCPIGTVLARAHRALGKLRGMMEVVEK